MRHTIIHSIHTLPAPIPCLQVLFPSRGFFSLSPIKKRFHLYLNMSYANVALTAARLAAFQSDMRDVVALAFQVG